MGSIRRSLAFLLICASFSAVACRQAPPPREYPLRGQIIAINRDTGQLTIRHEDIPGLMPAMVMSFTPRDRAELDRRQPGELITATLVVKDLASEIKDIRVTGTAAVDSQIARNATVPVLAPGDLVPEGDFLDQAGRPRHLSQWRGSVIVVTFIYTRCPLPDFCPRMERNFIELQKELRAAGLTRQVALVTVTFDPAYDTPAVLNKHAADIGADTANWTYLTGDLHAIERFAAQFGVSIIRNPADARDITHNLRTAVIDSAGRLREMFSGNQWTPAEVLAAVRTLLPARTT